MKILDQACEYAESVGARHLETSAKLNEGIDMIFIELSKEMMKCHDEKQKQSSNSTLQRNNSMRRTLVVEDDQNSIDGDNTETTVRNGCCSR